MFDLSILGSTDDQLWFIIFVQVLGLIAMGLELYSANQKSDKKLIRLIALSSVVFAVHFYFLSAIPAALSEIITAIRFYIADKYRKIWVGLLFIGFYILCAIFVTDRLFDVFPFVASIFGTIAVFFLNGIPMRILFICGQSLWAVYNFIVFSLGGFILCLALIMMTATTIYRLYKVKEECL